MQDRLIIILFISTIIFTGTSCMDKSECNRGLNNMVSLAETDSLYKWQDNDNTYMVSIVETTDNISNNSLKVRKIVFYTRGKVNENKQIYEYDVGMDHLIGISRMSDESDLLLSLWIGGSAYHLVVFWVKESQVKMVLNTGSHNLPEIADITNSGNYQIIISEPALLIDRESGRLISSPIISKIYKWDGSLFRLSEERPWNRRFSQN